MLSIRDHYLEHLVVRGASSEVWSGLRLGPGGFAVPVALKTLTTSNVDSAEHVRAFLAEARAASVVCHPNVVHSHELVHEHGRYWLGMELVRGWTVRALLAALDANAQSIPIPIALTIARDIAAGLEAIHEAGLVHRNVAPDNLMLASSGRAVILDFGCAAWHVTERVRSTPPTVALDLPYASPELRGRLPVDPRSDVYSLGVLLHHLVPRRGNVPFFLDGIISRAIDPDPARRFPSARDLEIALDLVAMREGWMCTPTYVAAFLADVMRTIPVVDAPSRAKLEAQARAKLEPASRETIEPVPPRAILEQRAAAPPAKPAPKAAAKPARPTADGSLIMKPRPRTGLVGVGAKLAERPDAPKPRAPTGLGKTRIRLLRH